MRLAHAALAFGALLLSPLAAAQMPPVSHTVSVSGMANIFGAGLGTVPRGTLSCGEPNGALPIEVPIPAGASHFTVSNTSGSVNCTSANVSASADGSCLGATPTNITSDTGISGIVNSGANMFLTGVMLDASVPAAPAPASLDFSSNSNFTSLSPQLRQSFFIGDGFTGTGSGLTQQFVIPAGATRLFLGYADAWNYSGLEGCYSDNSGGSLSATVTFGFRAAPTTVPATSTFGAWLLGALIALGSLMVLRRKA